MNVRIRQVILGVVISGLLGSILVVAQQRSPWNREEWNDYQDAKSGATPADIVAGFDAFLQKHPDSALRVVFQNELVDALYKTENRARILEVVDGFLAVDKETFMAAGYTEVNYPLTIYSQHRTYTFVTREILGAGGKLTDAQMRGGVGHARTGLELLPEAVKLQKQAGATAEQADPAAAADELMYHQVLATLTWRMKDYDGALPELSYLIEKYPDDANLSLQMGYSNLNKSEPDSLKSIWYLARAVVLGHPQAESARGRVLREIVRHTGVAPSCMMEDIDAVYVQAGSQVHPPQFGLAGSGLNVRPCVSGWPYLMAM